MATEYKVSLDKVIKELSLKTVYMPVDASTIDIQSPPPVPQPVSPLWERLPAHMISARAV